MSKQLFKRLGGQFHPLPTMVAPVKPDPNKYGFGAADPMYSSDMHHYEGNMEIYNEHIAGKIPIEQVSNFAETKEGEVYELKYEYFVNDTFIFAVPVATNQREEDLWNEVFDLEKQWHRMDFIREAKKLFTITRKNQP